MANFNININSNVQETNNIAGENLSKGDLVYLSDDQKYYKADASLVNKSTTELRMSLDDVFVDETITLLTYGYFEFETPILNAGEKYYVSTNPGVITDQLYIGSSNIVRYIGTAYDDKTILFNPDNTYISENGKKINGVPIATESSSTNSEHVHVEADISDLDKYTQQEVDQLISSSNGNYVTLDTPQLITSEKTFRGVSTFEGALVLDSNPSVNPNDVVPTLNWGNFSDYGTSAPTFFNKLAFINDKLAWSKIGQSMNSMSGSLDQNNTDHRTYTFPDKNGTVAMISDLPIISSGSFTPTLSHNGGNYNLSTSSASYTRVGNQVSVALFIHVVGSVTVGTGALIASTLPFAGSPAAFLNCTISSSNKNFYSIIARTNGSDILFLAQEGFDGGNDDTLSNVGFPNNSTIRISGVYNTF